MKLIVDISEYDYEYIHNAYSIPQDINVKMAESIIFAKPLPQFKEEAIPYQVSETEVDCYQDPYATGWNDCLRAITGKTE